MILRLLIMTFAVLSMALVGCKQRGKRQLIRSSKTHSDKGTKVNCSLAANAQNQICLQEKARHESCLKEENLDKPECEVEKVAKEKEAFCADEENKGTDHYKKECERKVTPKKPTGNSKEMEYKCGDKVTEPESILKKDLSCTSGDYGLVIEQDDVVIDGQIIGVADSEPLEKKLHKISGNSLKAGILVRNAQNVTIQNFNISQLSNGVAIRIVDSQNVTIKGNVLKSNRGGVAIQADQSNVDDISVIGNVIDNSREFGVEASGSDKEDVTSVEIAGNDFKNSKTVAIRLDMPTVSISSASNKKDRNIYHGSKNALVLSGETVIVENFDLLEDVSGTMVEIKDTITAKVRGAILGKIHTKGERSKGVGLRFSNVDEIDISDVHVRARKVGMQFNASNKITEKDSSEERRITVENSSIEKFQRHAIEFTSAPNSESAGGSPSFGVIKIFDDLVLKNAEKSSDGEQYFLLPKKDHYNVTDSEIDPDDSSADPIDED